MPAEMKSQTGPFVPTVILERPDVVKAIHEDFAHAGSDILVACQYYANKHKMASVGMVEAFEKLNRVALEICRETATETGTLAAGNLCNSVEYQAGNTAKIQEVRDMFREQVLWAKETEVNLFVCETFREYGEASLALNVVKEYAPNVPCVVTLAPYSGSETEDADALERLYNEGATIVGLNCARGPETMIDSLTEVRETYKGPLSASPLPFRTTEADPTWMTLRDPKTGKLVFPEDLDTVNCSCEDIANFGKAALKLDVGYLGICCGNSARYTRALAQGIL